MTSILVYLAILAYGLYFSVFTVSRHRALMTQSFDLSVYVQSLWNTLHGDFMLVTIQPGKTIYFQHHFAPSMLLFVPLYAIWPDPEWLLILQSIIVASGAWPIYRLVTHRTGRGAAGLVFALVYLLNPALQAANLYDFHEITIAAPLLIWAWYFARTERWIWFIVIGATALGFREEAVIIMLGIGFILALQKSTRKHGLFTLAISGVWLLILLLVSFQQTQYDMNAELYFNSRFNLGSTPFHALGNILSNPAAFLTRITTPQKIYYLTNLFAPVGYLPFFSWETLFLVAPSVGLNLISEYEVMFSPAQAQYNALVAPFIVYTAAVGLNYLATIIAKRMKFGPIFWQNILLIFVLTLSFGYQLRLAHLPYSPYFKSPHITERHRIAQQIAAEIPPGSSLSIQDNLAPHASHRRELYVFPIVNQAEFVYLDLVWVDAIRSAEILDLTDEVNSLLTDPQYDVIINKQRLLLLKRVEQ